MLWWDCDVHFFDMNIFIQTHATRTVLTPFMTYHRTKTMHMDTQWFDNTLAAQDEMSATPAPSLGVLGVTVNLKFMCLHIIIITKEFQKDNITCVRAWTI